MSIKKYNFQEFTDKDMFEMRLAGDIPDFGHISSTMRKPFVDFCVEHGFISFYAATESNRTSLYYVHITFRFTSMFAYDARPVILTDQNCMAIVYEDFKMTNTVGPGPK